MRSHIHAIQTSSVTFHNMVLAAYDYVHDSLFNEKMNVV
jgi:hypothetical protein